MSILDLRNQIDDLAIGPRGNDDLRAVISHASAVVVIVGAFEHLRTREDLVSSETEILRLCCRLIRTNFWHGLTEAAIAVEAALPPPPVPQIIQSAPEPEATEG